jgi:acyl carrier protein phosphodiesterase
MFRKELSLHRAIDTFTDAHPVLDEVLKNCIQDTIIMLVLSLMFLRSFSGEKLTTYSNENLSDLLLPLQISERKIILSENGKVDALHDRPKLAPQLPNY